MNDIAVCVECKDGSIRKVSLELLSQALKMAPSVYAVLLGHGVGEIAEELKSFAHKVIVVDHPDLEEYRFDTYVSALTGIITKYAPSMVLGASTTTGKDLFPRLAARLKTAFIADAVGIDHVGGEIKVKKPLFGGRIISWKGVRGAPLITFRPNSCASLSRPGMILRCSGMPWSWISTKKFSRPKISTKRAVARRASS